MPRLIKEAVIKEAETTIASLVCFLLLASSEDAKYSSCKIRSYVVSQLQLLVDLAIYLA